MVLPRPSSFLSRALALAFALAALPACPPRSAPPAAPAPPPAPVPVSLADTLAATGQHAILLRAFEAAGMTAGLRGEVTATIFAPTDEAFGRLPAGTLDAVLADRERLGALLGQHVLLGQVDRASLEGVTTLATLGGQHTVTHAGGLHIGGAAVVRADVKATNGIVHVIDAVLLPPPPPAPQAASEPPPETLPDGAAPPPPP